MVFGMTISSEKDKQTKIVMNFYLTTQRIIRKHLHNVNSYHNQDNESYLDQHN